MALNFQFAEVNYAKLTADDKKWNDAFIWGCLIVDLHGITNKNAEEWAWRYRFAVKLNGAFYYHNNKEPFIPSVDEVKKRIGLTTNVSDKTRGQFIKKQVSLFK